MLRRAPYCWIRRAIQKSRSLTSLSSDALPASGLALPEAKEQSATEATWYLLRLEPSILSKPPRTDEPEIELP